MKTLIVEISYEAGNARDISVDDVRRAVVAFVPHKIVSVKIAAQQSAEAVCTCISFGSDTAHPGVIMGDCPIHGTDKRNARTEIRKER